MPTRGQRVARSLRLLGVCFFAVASLHADDVVPPAQPDEPEPAAEAAPPRTVVRIFGDIDWRSRRDDVPSTFVLGQIDVFLTSELAPNLSVLAETVLESPKNGDEQIAEVERFQLQYSPVDAFTVSVGRMHTMLGFWNQAYHHGAWLQTTAFRPEIYRFEDDDGGGLLPVHEVGVRLSGAASIRPLRFEYAASLVNGRASDPSRVLTFQDENGAKAVHLWAGISPRGLPHLQFGGAAVFDTIPPDSAGVRPAPLDEKIWGGFVVFQGSRLEVLAEVFAIHHRDKVTSVEWKSRGLYAQGAWEFGRWKPYYRYDWVDRDEGDPYYPEGLQDVDKHTIGLRVDPWSRVALKVEASRARFAGGEPFNAAAIQAAFTF
jgi:hypothetical protein